MEKNESEMSLATRITIGLVSIAAALVFVAVVIWTPYATYKSYQALNKLQSTDLPKADVEAVYEIRTQFHLYFATKFMSLSGVGDDHPFIIKLYLTNGKEAYVMGNVDITQIKKEDK